MREIKFRYWNKKDGWCGAFAVHQTGLVRFGDTEPIWQTPEEDGGVLMQYTGLKDRNGKQIYEGDVIDWESGDGISRMVMEIKQDTLGGRFQTIPYINSSSEVIGNIYENPELLAKENDND